MMVMTYFCRADDFVSGTVQGLLCKLSTAILWNCETEHKYRQQPKCPGMDRDNGGWSLEAGSWEKSHHGRVSNTDAQHQDQPSDWETWPHPGRPGLLENWRRADKLGEESVVIKADKEALEELADWEVAMSEPRNKETSLLGHRQADIQRKKRETEEHKGYDVHVACDLNVTCHWGDEMNTKSKNHQMCVDCNVPKMNTWNKHQCNIIIMFSTQFSIVLRFDWHSFNDIISLLPLLLQCFNGTWLEN